MTTSPEPTQVPLLLAQLCYFEIPRNAWPRTLLRARQLGAHGVATAVRWSWHAPTSELIDLDGTSDPQRDLIGFVEACARLNLALLLDFGSVTDDTIPRADLPAWLAATPLSEHERGVNAPRPSAERSEAARHWIAACSRSLVAYQAPDGPIVALRHAGDLQLAGWLRDNGWAVPIAQAEPNYGDQLSDSAAGWLGDFAGAAILPGAARPTLEPANRAAEPLLRPDGSARPRFWRAKSLRMLVGAAGSDFAAARAPADLALIAHAQIAPLAQRLAAAGLTLDQIDPEDATPARLARYVLALAPAELAEQHAISAASLNRANLALVGEWPGEQPPATVLAGDISADEISELIEERGGHARYAWADNAAMAVDVRYGPEYTYIVAHNRQDVAYNGLLAYRAPAGDVLHLHIGLGPYRAGIVMLREDEVVGVAIDGDGAEGGWLARGLTSSIVFNAGAGGVAPCGSGLLVTAPQSGRFQIRRSSGWDDMRACRVLLNGKLVAARVQIDATHMLLPYTAEDEHGQTDMYMVLPDERSLPATVRDYLATLLRARALGLETAAELAGQIAVEAGATFEQASRALRQSAEHLDKLEDYLAAWSLADDLLRPGIAGLQANDTPSASTTSRDDIDRIVSLIVSGA